jgi:hypothetical protein
LSAFTKEFLFNVDVEILLDGCKEESWVLGGSGYDLFQDLLALQV